MKALPTLPTSDWLRLARPVTISLTPRATPAPRAPASRAWFTLTEAAFGPVGGRHRSAPPTRVGPERVRGPGSEGMSVTRALRCQI